MKTKQLLLTWLMLILALALKSQITFVIDSLPGYTPESDQLYIAHNFNNFKNGDPANAMHKNQQGKWQITLNPPSGNSYIDCRINRGTWFTRESDSLEYLIGYRRIGIANPKTVRIKVINWYDHKNKPTTAASNVSLVSRAFPMPELGLDCNLHVYLPPDYDESRRSYPVMYALDGNELFDNYESIYNYEAKLDETLNKLAEEGYEVPIVAAVSNWDARNSILSPWDYSNGGLLNKGTGKKFINFLTNTLKPYVDSAYRTLPGRENTGIFGASLGGLISFYAAICRPDVFSKAGIYSPSYWVSDSIWTFVRDAEKIHPMRLYQLVGSKEQEAGDNYRMVDNVIRMNEELGNLGFSRDEITFKIVVGGEHLTSTWGPELRKTFLWLFPEQSSSTGKDIKLHDITVYPNPAWTTLYLDTPVPVKDLFMGIYNLTGEMVKSEIIHSVNQIDVGSLPPGLYMLRITGRGINYSGKFIKE